MNWVVALCGLFPLVTGVSVTDEAQAKIVQYESSNDGAGNYSFSYETSNGIFRNEIGYLVNIGQEDEHITVQGSYSYTDVEGKLVFVEYTADENGFQVKPPVSVPPAGFSALPPSAVATLLGK